MPRHLISDAHEWINEIPTVLIYYLAKSQGNGLGKISGERKPCCPIVAEHLWRNWRSERSGVESKKRHEARGGGESVSKSQLLNEIILTNQNKMWENSKEL